MSGLVTGDNKFGPARWYVSNTLVDGCTHTTIASAIASATAGDDIFIKPNTYTENLTLKAGVNLLAWDGDSETPNVIIIGKCTFTTAGTVSLSNINLQTNSDFCIAVTGSAASVLNLNNCYLNASNNTAISFTSSSASAQINLSQCGGNLGTTGIAFFAHSSAGDLNIEYCDFENTGGSTTASTASAGTLDIRYTRMVNALTTSSTNACDLLYSNFPLNGVTALTLNGNGSVSNSLEHCILSGGSSSALSVGTGTTLGAYYNEISSSNTNAVTGAGTINYAGLTFSGSSSTINTSTANAKVISAVVTPTAAITGITAHQVLIGEASSNVVGVTPSTSGFVLTSNGTSADPSFQALPPMSLTWAETSGSFSAVANNGYILTGASTPTLPTSPATGTTIAFICNTGSTVTVTAGGTNVIRVGGAVSAAGGTCASGTQGNSLILVYGTTNTQWCALGGPEGTWTVT